MINNNNITAITIRVLVVVYRIIYIYSIACIIRALGGW